MTTPKNEWEERFRRFVRKDIPFGDHWRDPIFTAKVQGFIHQENEKSEAETLKKVLEVVEDKKAEIAADLVRAIVASPSQQRIHYGDGNTYYSFREDQLRSLLREALSDLTDKLTHLTKQ